MLVAKRRDGKSWDADVGAEKQIRNGSLVVAQVLGLCGSLKAQLRYCYHQTIRELRDEGKTNVDISSGSLSRPSIDREIPALLYRLHVT